MIEKPSAASDGNPFRIRGLISRSMPWMLVLWTAASAYSQNHSWSHVYESNSNPSSPFSHHCGLVPGTRRDLRFALLRPLFAIFGRA